jgi:cell division protease FtsH
MSRFLRTGLIFVVILYGAITFFNAWNPTEGPLPVTYSQFAKEFANVDNFHLLSDGREFLYTVKGNDELVYRSTLPPGYAAKVVPEMIAQGASVVSDPPPKASGWGSMILISILPVMLLIGALVWMSKRAGGAAASMGGNPATLVDPEKNTTTLADVAGNPGDFDDVYELIDFLKEPKKYWDAGATLPHGILLYGPPGTGKTLLARAMAGEANVPFFTITGSAFVEMFVGVGASRVRDMFKALRDAAPAILFIDEIDALAGHRVASSHGAGNREADQTLLQLLTEMDGFEDHASIMVIGATNRPDALDPAILRPGRFDRIVSVNMPDVNARTKILEVHTKDRNFSEEIDLHTIAKGTPGFSGADLENLVNEAAMLVAKDERTEMTMADLDGARDRVMMGREKSLVMDDKEKKMTAYHEAGHAIVGHNVPEHDPIYKISIVPRGRALGVTMYLPEGDRYSHSRTYKNSQLVSLMGGRAAEELKFGKNAVTTGASNDLERATIIARDMVTKWGFSETGLISFDDRDADLVSEDTRMKIDEQVRMLLDKAYKKAKAILNKNKMNLRHVAEALIEKETIDQLEFVELIGAKDETLQ